MALPPIAQQTLAVFNRIPNQQWCHRTGTVYTVVLIANLHSEDFERFPLTVVYRDNKRDMVWSRPVVDFIKSCKPAVETDEMAVTILQLKYAFMETL